MKKGTPIGVKDSNKKPLHIGDYVIHRWGWFVYNNKQTTYLQVHRLTWNKENKRVLMGTCYNQWKGNEVTRIPTKAFKEMDIPLDKDFFIEDDKCVLLTGGHLFGERETISDTDLALFLGPPW